MSTHDVKLAGGANSGESALGKCEGTAGCEEGLAEHDDG